jgi:phosphoesterase RecJ-like protein
MVYMTSILDAIKGKKRIGIGGHVRPDGDCIGSSLAVYNYLCDNVPDGDIHIFLQEIPNIYKFLRNSDKIEEPGTVQESFDIFIALDCGDSDRLGPSAEYFKNAGSTFCIDHHLSNSAFADINEIEPHSSSTCEMVFDRMDQKLITKQIAECLYCGLISDTGQFQYSCTSSHTMYAAGVLMDKGIDYPYIVDHTFSEKTFEQNRILGVALLKAELLLDGKLIFCNITMEEMKQYNVMPKHLEGIVAMLRATKDVEVACFCYETEDHDLKVSLRASGDVNLALIASKYNGGGHAKAAGCTVSMSPEEFKNIIINEIKERL